MKRKLLMGLILCSILTILLLIAACKNTTSNTSSIYSQDIFAMDTHISVQLVADSQELAIEGLEAVERSFSEIDKLTNRFDSASEVTAINQQAGLQAVKVSKDLFNIVETAIEWSDKTGGDFNILIGAVMDLWGFATEDPRLPAPEELALALNLIDYQQIILDSEQSTIFLPQKGMVMDLGGIAKGYATDKAVEALKEIGIEDALINAGGNVYAAGKKPDGSKWIIGVQDPREPQGIAALLTASDSALVSSGDYRRYVEIGGIHYHHIIDPIDGYPSKASAGTTIIMKSATIADILSTAIFIKGPEAGIKLAEELTQVDAAMLITSDGGVYRTESLAKYWVER